MRLLRLLAPVAALVLLPHIAQAQRFGFGVGAPAVGAAANAARGTPVPSSSPASTAPALPPLPPHLPAASTPAIPSTSLQPLNLQSMHMAPPPPTVLQIDRLRAPQMCVDPKLQQR